MLFSVLRRKGKVKAPLSPCEVQVLAKRRQVSAGGSLRARSPAPAQLSSLREPAAQGPTRSPAPQVTQIWGGREAGSTDCNPGRLPLPLVTEAGMVEMFTAASGLGLVSRWSW